MNNDLIQLCESMIAALEGFGCEDVEYYRTKLERAKEGDKHDSVHDQGT